MRNKQLIKTAAFVLFVLAMYLIRGALVPLVLSIALFYILKPLKELVLKVIPKKVPFRIDIAIILTFVIFIAIVALIVEFIVPQIATQFANLVSSIPGYFDYFKEMVKSSQKWYLGARLPEQVNVAVFDMLKQAFGLFASFSQGVVAGILGVFGQFIGLVIIPVVVYYMLREEGRLFEGVESLLPRSLKDPIRSIFEKVNYILKSYVESQAIICTLIGIVTWLILYFLEVPFSLILGIIAAVTELIPIIGPIVGGIPAVMIAGIVSPMTAVNVVILYGAVQFVAGYIIAPKIMGDKLGIHPLTVVLGVLILGNLIGVWGIFFAAPIIAILKVIYLEIKKD